MTRARCEMFDCRNEAAIHLRGPHSRQRVCRQCAEDLARFDPEAFGVVAIASPPAPVVHARFPRADLVLHMVAVAEVLRNAATELDELAGAAHGYEIGTLRRKVRAVVVGAMAFADGSTSEGDPS